MKSASSATFTVLTSLFLTIKLEEQSLKAFGLTVVPFANVIYSNEAHPSKLFSPNSLTETDPQTSFKFVQPLNAPLPTFILVLRLSPNLNRQRFV